MRRRGLSSATVPNKDILAIASSTASSVVSMIIVNIRYEFRGDPFAQEAVSPCAVWYTAPAVTSLLIEVSAMVVTSWIVLLVHGTK